MANNFADDPSCVAVYNFESGALTTDSKNGNNLTAVNTPTEDTGDYQQGSCCAVLAATSDQYFTLLDVDQPANWPFKSGGAYREGTYVGWFKFASVTNNQGIFGKLAVNEGCGLRMQNGWWYLDWDNGLYATSQAAAIDIWYHVAVRMSPLNNYSAMRIFRSSDSQILTFTRSAWGALDYCSAPFRIGSYNNGTDTLNGKVDEVAVFNRMLSDAEIDAIRGGTYDVGNPNAVGALSLNLLQLDYAIGGINSFLLQSDEILSSMGVYVLEQEFFNRGIRTFPLPNDKTVWQSQSGKRIFPMPGEQVV